MAIFQHALWGYELTYPDDWVHRSVQEAEDLTAEAFGASLQALRPGYTGPRSGQIAVRAEWNPTREATRPLWERKIGVLAGFMSAAKVGAAPWQLGPAKGLEAEIVLPKRENTRLWTGILAYGFHVMHFMVTHPKEDRDWFEPLATRIIASLRFLDRIQGLESDPHGIPLPPGYTPTDPQRLVDHIDQPERWRAYSGDQPADALQAFYVREAPNFGWEIGEYRPFPQNVDLGFARFQLEKSARHGSEPVRATLGIMPYGSDGVHAGSPANLVIRFS